MNTLKHLTYIFIFIPILFLVFATPAPLSAQTPTYTYQDDLYSTTQPTLSQGEILPDGRYHLGLSFAPAQTGTGETSGGWETSITLTEQSTVDITFDYTILLSGNTEPGEYTRLYYRDLVTSSAVQSAELQGQTGTTADHTQSGTINYSVSLNTGTYTFDFGAWHRAMSPSEYGEAWFDNITISITPSGGQPTYECSDGIDNDGDTLIDFSGVNPTNPDPGCTSSTDDDETDSNTPPVAISQDVVVNQDTSINIILQATDGDNDLLTYQNTQPTGTLTGTAPNLTYTPNSGYTGPDNFTFTAYDGTANSNVATVSINVQSSSPQPPLLWSTTYDCPDWTQEPGGAGDPTGCDSLTGYSDSNGSIPVWEQILADANYPGGGGGKGQRHWSEDGNNTGSGGTRINFNTGQTELWIRFYYAYADGYHWDNGISRVKLLYLDPVAAEVPLAVAMGGGGTGNHFRVNLLHGLGGTPPVQNLNSDNAYGWSWLYAGSDDDEWGYKFADGSWHWIEIHLLMDTDGTDGIVQYWADGVLVIDESNVDFDSDVGGLEWQYMVIGSNQQSPHNGPSGSYIDYDDIVISNTGPIGPVTGGTPDNTAPTTPQNLTANSVSSSQINLSWSPSNDNVAVTGYRIYRCTGSSCTPTLLTTTTNTSYSNTGLSAQTTYTYTVSAYDAVLNTSTQSTSASETTPADITGTILFQEDFEDTSFSSRGWYDNTGIQVSTIEHIQGNASAEYRFLQGAQTPTSGTASRVGFTESDEVYVSYWVKYSSNWEGSNRIGVHPHEFLLLTNIDHDWRGPAYSHLTGYIEQNEGTPRLRIQDGRNIDESNIGVDLTSITENRAVAGCNGDSDGYGDGQCYLSGSVHWNGKNWWAPSIYFQDSPGPFYKNDWHHIEAYFRLNSINGGIGVADGVLQYWYDDNLIINHNDVMMRTGEHPTMMFDQFLIAPWIGDGSPVDQTFWVDDLTIATSRPQQALRADINNPPDGDGIVNSLDWSIMRTAWGTNDPTADINDDGIVNTLDWSIMNSEWGQTI